LFNADGVMRVPWYESLWAMVRGLEKNSFGPGANYSYLRQLVMVVLLWGMIAAPPVSLVAGLVLGDPVLVLTGTGAFLATAVAAGVMPRKSVRDIFAFGMTPVGAVVVSLIMLRSAWKCLRNGGIDWRGTHYPIEELRKGQRVRLSPLG
jgi:hypothetical protein